MLLHLGNVLTVAVLLGVLAGLSLAAGRVVGSHLLARAAVPFCVVLPLFWVEHAVGLGRLGWLWMPGTALAALALWRWRASLRRAWKLEAAFHAGFFNALLWRYAFPSIDANSERLTDLTFLANYLPGGRLPPVDRWFPPHPFDQYYGLLPYAGALLGRAFGWDAGTAYNLAFCVVSGCVAVAAAGVIGALCPRTWQRLLAFAGLLWGGTGVSAAIHWIVQTPVLHSSMRFIGGCLAPGHVKGPGEWILGHCAMPPGVEPLDLPVELFSYLMPLGDLHPPLAGSYLLSLCLLGWTLSDRQPGSAGGSARVAAMGAFLAGVSLPATLVANAWVFPLHLALAAAWVTSRFARGAHGPQTDGGVFGPRGVQAQLQWFAAGLAAACVFVQPALARLGLRAIEYSTAIHAVPDGERTPWLPALIQFGPFLLLALLCVAGGNARGRAGWWCASAVGLGLLSELLWVDDLYSGRYERFNTAVKWWTWIISLVMIGVAPAVLASRRTWVRWAGAALLCWLLGFGFTLASTWVTKRKAHFGRLNGAGWLTEDNALNSLLEHLKSQPPGIVLQRVAEQAYTAAPALAIFSGHTALLGWPGHQSNWRGYRLDVGKRARDVEAFYSGAMAEPLPWLRFHRVDYVLWTRDEAGFGEDHRRKIDAALAPEFYWERYSPGGTPVVGLWQRVAR